MELFIQIFHNNPIPVSILSFLSGLLLGHRLGYSLAILRDKANREGTSLLESNKEYRKAFIGILKDFSTPETKNQGVGLSVKKHFQEHKDASILYSMELSGKKKLNFLKVWEKYETMFLEFMNIDRMRSQTNEDLTTYKDLVKQLALM